MNEPLHRNANMELLRILSMFMVLILHSLWQSGALDYLSGPHYFAYWIPESLSNVAVDVFVLLTGFFMVTGRFKLEKIVKLGGGNLELYTFIFPHSNSAYS